ncbi:cytosine permease [Jatrophihabitans cynanchi]|jgi:putative hydroxymethylpyrimidine transporter CytX|uniref:Cytosine permease n=1 Tax=Jatrophihabitans cynanchi TaxID=2944128 RepID=A0ABY7JXG4_9ACTN|nr:cytosine permease [Jatrophihabitans sp. SB3-54]WAX57267.1 cytosine permease [Jatrophihabitans sp. SB3-54]
MTTTHERSTTAGTPTEVGRTLADENPRTLTALDMGALWGNLGVSLLGFTGAIFVLVPVDKPMSLLAACVAVAVGTLLGTLGFAAAGIPGSDTGAPSMVLLRGLFGTKPSYLPTVLNVVQLLGWTTFELVTIATAMHQVAGGVPRWGYVLAGGVITTLLALRPLGWIRVLRRYVTVAVAVALVYLFVQLLRHPLPSFTHGGWGGFWIAVDTVIGVSVSWVPLASDYSRHARSARGAFAGTLVGYSLTQFGCYLLGLVALVTVATAPEQIFGSFIAVPLGTVAFGVLAVRELDQSFADTYSTAVSLQNFRPTFDRRLLALAVGTVATVCALALDINDYENFLTLIGSVFVPLLGVLVVDYFVISRRSWDLGEQVAARWSTLVAWLLGFVAYQLIYPGTIGWWQRMWLRIQDWLHFTPQSWMSASLTAFVVAAIATLVAGMPRRRREPEC